MKPIIPLLAIAALAGCATMPGVAAAPTAATEAKVETTVVSVAELERELMEADRKLGMLAQQKGLAAAIAETLDAEGFVLAPGGVLNGPQAALAGLQGATAAGPLFWQPDRVFVSKSGDFGQTTGAYIQVLVGQEAAQGRYVTTWRKTDAGEWRILSDVHMPRPKAMPVAAATPAKKKVATR